MYNFNDVFFGVMFFAMLCVVAFSLYFIADLIIEVFLYYLQRILRWLWRIANASWKRFK